MDVSFFSVVLKRMFPLPVQKLPVKLKRQKHGRQEICIFHKLCKGWSLEMLTYKSIAKWFSAFKCQKNRKEVDVR